MKTVIRLQNHGRKNHPYWWIVVMGYYKSRKGRFVEHVGYWIPRKTVTVQRSVILNKPRMRYWLAMGAIPSKKIAGFLSWVDMWPSPVLKYGYKTLYQKKVLDPKKPEFFEMINGFPQQRGIQAKFYDQIRNTEEENLFHRKVQIQNELNKQVKLSDSRNLEVENDINERSKKFYELRDQLYEYERDLNKLPSKKRDKLFHELNERASKGIIAEKFSPKLFKSESNEEELSQKAFGKNQTRESILLDGKMKEMQMSKTLAKTQAQYLRYLEQGKATLKRSEEDMHMLKPAGKDEIVSLVIKLNPDMTPNEVKDKANNIWEVCKESGIMPSKLDLVQWSEDVVECERVEDIFKDEFIKNEKVYIPTAYPINPFLDITKYDPHDYHEVSQDPEMKINHNKAYDLPGVDDLKLRIKKFERNINLTPKQPRRRNGFCSLQKEFSSMNLSFYSFILRKVENIKE